MKTAHFTIVLVVLLTPLQAQQKPKVELPQPVHGWSYLASKMVFPDLAMRAGLQATYRVNLIIDSTGEQANTDIRSIDWPPQSAIDSLFSQAIINAFSAVQWHAGTKNGIPTTNKISMIIRFTGNVGVDELASESGTKTTKVDASSNILIDSINVYQVGR